MNITINEPCTMFSSQRLKDIPAGKTFCAASHSYDKIMKNEPSVAIYMKTDLATHLENPYEFKSGSYAINLRNGNVYRFNKEDSNRLCYVLSAELAVSLQLG